MRTSTVSCPICGNRIDVTNCGSLDEEIIRCSFCGRRFKVARRARQTGETSPPPLPTNADSRPAPRDGAGQSSDARRSSLKPLPSPYKAETQPAAKDRFGRLLANLVYYVASPFVACWRRTALGKKWEAKRQQRVFTERINHHIQRLCKCHRCGQGLTLLLNERGQPETNSEYCWECDRFYCLTCAQSLVYEASSCHCECRAYFQSWYLHPAARAWIAILEEEQDYGELVDVMTDWDEKKIPEACLQGQDAITASSPRRLIGLLAKYALVRAGEVTVPLLMKAARKRYLSFEPIDALMNRLQPPLRACADSAHCPG